jgi:hypothetical protein
MIRLSTCFLLLFVWAFVVGCGGSTALSPVAEQDEISKWVAENPSPPETPVD